ncbi:MAG: hypothetical protein M0R66_07645 [Candidatus Omnitrophica bacterium]|nr:hypothetical protein [Candidatus Omnitrophota bacterium]
MTTVIDEFFTKREVSDKLIDTYQQHYLGALKKYSEGSREEGIQPNAFLNAFREIRPSDFGVLWDSTTLYTWRTVFATGVETRLWGLAAEYKVRQNQVFMINGFYIDQPALFAEGNYIVVYKNGISRYKREIQMAAMSPDGRSMLTIYNNLIFLPEDRIDIKVYQATGGPVTAIVKPLGVILSERDQLGLDEENVQDLTGGLFAIRDLGAI